MPRLEGVRFLKTLGHRSSTGACGRGCRSRVSLADAVAIGFHFVGDDEANDWLEVERGAACELL